MDLNRFLYLCYIFIFHIGISILLLVLLVIYFPLDACLERISLYVLLILVIRIDKCIAFVSIFMKKSALEFEATIIASLIFLLNSMEEDCDMEDENFLSIFSKVIFYGVLIANSLAYLYSLLVILFFGVMVLMILLRGGQNNMSLQLDNRGMTADQMASIEEKTYLQIKAENPNMNIPNNQSNQNIQNNSQAQINIDLAPRQDQNENEKVCSICLSEFQDPEMVCKLPECNHIFHNECI